MSYKRSCVSRGTAVSERSSPVWADVIKQAELRRLLCMSLGAEEERKRLILWQLFGRDRDTAYYFWFDRAFRCVKTMCVSVKGVRMGESYGELMESGTAGTRAVYFAVAHNHVNEPLRPSPDDGVLTRTLMKRTEQVFGTESAFLGHYITDGFSAVKLALSWDL